MCKQKQYKQISSNFLKNKITNNLLTSVWFGYMAYQPLLVI